MIELVRRFLFLLLFIYSFVIDLFILMARESWFWKCWKAFTDRVFLKWYQPVFVVYCARFKQKGCTISLPYIHTATSTLRGYARFFAIQMKTILKEKLQKKTQTKETSVDKEKTL